MTDYSKGSSADGNHLSWIAAARREVADLGERSTYAGPVRAGGARSVNTAQLRESLANFLPGYEIRDEVFRGGQGVVFRAVQKGTRRDVAIKLIREGPLVGATGLARFEREVQILGQLRHPNIVTILESGAVADSLYFVMDFIDGWSLDDHIASAQLAPREVLRLFERICDAVNVAHLRGVIHRDLKPGNVRVDRDGAPHVLDFGLAKIHDDDLAVAMTVTGQFVGSLPWASPEQVEARPDGIDIRTDVYSIGVMLFHALTGKFPYSVGESFRQTIEHICRTDPPKPSTIRESLDDEIDQIVLKCLRKDREQRYQSAGNLARDLRRYLDGEAIEAKRDSAWYVVRKAARKHRVTATVAGLTLSLIVYAIGSLIYFYDRESGLRHAAEQALIAARHEAKLAAEARDEAIRQTRISQAINEFFNGDILAAVAPEAMGRDVTLLQALDAAAKNVDARFEDEPVIAAEIHFMIGNTYTRLGNLERAEEHLAAARRDFAEALGENHENALTAMNDLARVRLARGKTDEALDMFRDCLERRRRIFGAEDEEAIVTQANLGWVLATMAKYDEAEPLLVGAYELRRRLNGPEHEETLTTMNNVALLYSMMGRHADAAELSEKELAIARRIMPDDPGIYTSMTNLATIYRELERFDRAEELYRDALAGRERSLGRSHPSTLLTMNNLATLVSTMGRRDEAKELLEKALPAALSAHGEDLPLVMSLRSNLGAIYDEEGRHAEAEPLHAAAVRDARRQLPDDHPTLALFVDRHAKCRAAMAERDMPK